MRLSTNASPWLSDDDDDEDEEEDDDDDGEALSRVKHSSYIPR